MTRDQDRTGLLKLNREPLTEVAGAKGGLCAYGRHATPMNADHVTPGDDSSWSLLLDNVFQFNELILFTQFNQAIIVHFIQLRGMLL